MSNPLTAAEVTALPEGTPIDVIWSGGNGPHRYTVTHAPDGTVCARSESDRPDYYDYDGRSLSGVGSFVGRARYETRVWLAASSLAEGDDE